MHNFYYNVLIKFSFLWPFFQKSSNHKHCILFKASRHGIERLEIYDKEEDKNPQKIITLENCVKITQEPPNQINIVTKTGTLTLNALNEMELKHWVEALQDVAFKDKTSTLMRHNSVMENDLYCTSFSDGVFTVTLNASDTKQLNCSLEPKTYTMQLTASEIQLKNIEASSVSGTVAKWPYRYIRKYGVRDGKVIFEAGRKCDTGEGIFRFYHSNPQEVFRCMSAKMKSMKKLINGESISSLDCGEHQLNAALSMEPGSRSPLPPSQNHSESEQSQTSDLLRGFISSNDSLNNVSSVSSIASSVQSQIIMKITPCKPPRKSVPTMETVDKSHKLSQKTTKYQDYEPVALAQTGNSDVTKPTSIVLKSSPPPPLPTSPIPNNNNNNGTHSKNNILPIFNEHHIIKSPINSPVTDQPPQIPIRYESMNHDDRNYERIESISNAWKTLGVNDVKHTEHMKSSEDDFSDFVWQRSQSQKEFGANRRPPITVNAYCDADDMSTMKKSTDDNYDKLEFFAAKSNSSSNDYRTIVTVNSPAYKKQTSQPVTSNDYEIIGECGTINKNTSSNIDQISYRKADDSFNGYGIIRKPTNTPPSKSPQSAQQKTGTSSSTDDLLNHRKFNGLDYAIVSKPKQV